jgi:hypothetical protein
MWEKKKRMEGYVMIIKLENVLCNILSPCEPLPKSNPGKSPTGYRKCR